MEPLTQLSERVYEKSEQALYVPNHGRPKKETKRRTTRYLTTQEQKKKMGAV